MSTGSITWFDLTVEEADAVRAFYESVVGWIASPVSMDGYEDYNMNVPTTGEPVAGICHARGFNAGLPAQWLLYVTVANLATALEACRAGGGTVLREATGSSGQYAVIKDPAGACLVLYEPTATDAPDPL